MTSQSNKKLLIPVRLLSPTAQLPQAARPGDSGHDLFLPENVELGPFESKKVFFDISLLQTEPSTILLTGRSGWFSKGLNTEIGVIDHTYKGNIAAVLTNTTPERMQLKAGMRPSQLVILPLVPAEFEVKQKRDADCDISNEREESGFGSTGC